MVLAALLALNAGCNDDSEVFYTITYPVVRIEAAVTDATGDSNGVTNDEGTTENPVLREIEAQIVAAAPVKAGGSYTLLFSKYNRGLAPIDTATDAGKVTGAFIKEPGATDIWFYFLEQGYTCAVSAYRDEAGASKVLFTVDLTEQYQALYPDAGITKAERREYTSTNAI